MSGTYDPETDPACSIEDPELFFPVSTREYDPQAQAAKAVCARCPLRVGCLEIALARHYDHGIWGGTGPVERRRMHQDRRRQGIPIESPRLRSVFA